MGYVPFNKNGSELLFQLISDWYETKSVIITSKLKFSNWNKVFVDPRLTSALVDRLIHYAHILTIKGESFRLKNALSNTESLKGKIGWQHCVLFIAMLCTSYLQNTTRYILW